MAKKGKRRCDTLPVLHPDAAGIDVGASELFVAVSADRDPHPVRSFPTFTRDLHALADWLEQSGIHSVAMESTSVYWIPVYQILEARGLEVYLVNAQHVKNVPGRKTDVSDCQWLQYLHSVGLLRASFRPPGFICAIRSLWRHRASLIQMAAEHVLHMQKALDQMNFCFCCPAARIVPIYAITATTNTFLSPQTLSLIIPPVPIHRHARRTGRCEIA